MYSKFLLLVVFLSACAVAPSAQNDSDLRYVGNSLEECSRIKFICASEFEYFSDDKGCGCKKIIQEEKKVTVYCKLE